MARTPAHRRKRDPYRRAVGAPRKRPTLPVHQFAATTATDHRGERICTCGQPEDRPCHQLPDVDPDVSAAERRRVGEREEDDA